MSDKAEERTLEQTPTWAVAAVCFVLIAMSISIEHLICRVAKWLNNRNKRALYEALEKVKTELMLMGFISLLLTIGQGPLSEMCVPKRIANTWQPCDNDQEAAKYGGDTATTGDRRRLWFLYSATASTREYDKCAERGQVALVSAYGIHQLHIFIFVLAVFHVLYCITTWTFGSTKLKKWKAWEDETGTSRHGFNNEPERFSSASDRSFGHRHLNIWSSSSISLWIECFFRQFFGSVTKHDYLTLHGFIKAQARRRETEFDFNQDISRSLEGDFVVVVGITPVLWLAAVLFLLINTDGWFAYLWLPFIPLVIILLVGTKLQVIITKLGLSIQGSGGVVMVAPVVQPGDDLFWFGRPRFILFLIHLVLFQNAFQLAFLFWSTCQFTINSCYHKKGADIIIKMSTGFFIQILCSYVTLPLYALVTGIYPMIRTIFNDIPYSSRPAAPTHGTSPVELHNCPNHILGNHASPSSGGSNFDNDRWDPESLRSPRQHHTNDTHHGEGLVISEEEMVIQEPT